MSGRVSGDSAGIAPFLCVCSKHAGTLLKWMADLRRLGIFFYETDTLKRFEQRTVFHLSIEKLPYHAIMMRMKGEMDFANKGFMGT